jgi:hypothetical protein
MDDDGHARELGPRSYFLEELPSVHAGHQEVEDHDAEVLGSWKRFECLLTVTNSDHGVATAFEQLAHRFAKVVLVFY